MHSLQRIEQDFFIPLQHLSRFAEARSWNRVWHAEEPYTRRTVRLERTHRKIQTLGQLDVRFEQQKALDVGCGDGTTLRHLHDVWSCLGCGVDIAPAAIQRARSRSEHYADLTFRIADGRELPFPNASFDLVLSFGVIEHAKDFQRFLSESRRVLRPGGSLALIQPHLLSFGVFQRNWLQWFGRWPYGYQRDFGFWQLRTYLHEHGFRSIRFRTEPAPPDLPIPSFLDRAVHALVPVWGHYLYMVSEK